MIDVYALVLVLIPCGLHFIITLILTLVFAYKHTCYELDKCTYFGEENER